MIKLLKIECKKIMTYKVFWILFGLYFFFLAAGILMAEFMINHMVDGMNHRLPIPLPHVTLYYFPEVWQNLAFFASIRYVLIFPAIIVIMLITNEFTYRTIRQNIINGMSKGEFIVSKLMVIFLMAVFTSLVLGFGAFFIGVAHSGLNEMAILAKGIPFIFGFFVAMLSFLIYSFFFGFLFRNTGLAIALFTLYTLIIEPIFYYFLKSPLVFKNQISAYLPVNAAIRVTEYPAITVLKKIMGLELQRGISLTTCAIPLLYGSVMIAMVYWIMYKRDL